MLTQSFTYITPKELDSDQIHLPQIEEYFVEINDVF